MAGAGSLEGCRVVVTRPAHQAEELARPLRAAGAAVRVRPLVRLEAPADGGRALREAVQHADRYDWIVFTSANAVRQGGVGLPTDTTARIACVGEATARAASELGLEVDLVPAQFTGEALARALAAEAPLRGRRVLWPRASGARETVRAALEAAGAVVDDPEAYRTSEDGAAAERLHAELVADEADLVTFTSPSGVRAFASAGHYAGAVGVIGTVTRDAALAAGLDVRVQPARHTVAGLVDAIASWYRSRG